MPTLIVEDVPPDVYELLQRRAATRQRSVSDEAVRLLREVLQEDSHSPPRLPDLVPGEEIPAPCDLPRSGPVRTVPAYPGKPRLPDSLVE